MNVNAYTANRDTGNLTVVDWKKYKSRWVHLQNIDFPHTSKRPVVDILIRVDCADLLCAISEVRGGPGEPIARLTPLGWTCVGNPGACVSPVLQTSFSYTYFVKGQSEIDTINANLKKFWDIEDGKSFQETPIVRIEEQIAMKNVEKSMEYENQMYRVGILWKENKPTFPNNYGMALHRLENTETRLERSPDIATTYNQCIEQYIKKAIYERFQYMSSRDPSGTYHMFQSSDLTKIQRKQGLFVISQKCTYESVLLLRTSHINDSYGGE